MARTFGERFVEEFRLAGGSTANWPPDAMTALKKADRKTFINAFSRVSSEFAKTLVIAAHTAEPETLARRAAAARSADSGRDADWLAVLTVIAMSGH
jgi:hypothetical protein